MVLNIVTCLAIASVINAAYAVECPNGWTTFQGSCYMQGEQAMNFSDGQNFCRGKNSDSQLAHIDTAQEQLFIRSFLSNFQANAFWIGLSDRHTEGVYLWSDDHPAGYFSWGHGQPDNAHGADCVISSQHFHYNWADAPCNSFHHPLCELNIGAGELIEG